NEVQLHLLDQYAGHQALLNACQQSHQQWRQIDRQIQQLQQQQQQHQARSQLLEYQVQELDEFALQPGEYQQIEAEHKRLANSSNLIEQSQQALFLLSDGDEHSVHSLLQQTIALVERLHEDDPQLADTLSMLHEGMIQIQESSNELAHYHSQLDVDPNRLVELEARLSRAMTLARKHQVTPAELAEHHQALADELSQIAGCDDQLEQLEQARQQAQTQVQKHSLKLSKSRERFAKELNQRVTENLQALAMPHAQFVIEVDYQPEQLSPQGSDKVQFLVTTNPGQPLQSIAKTASGGELSRIGLAIQVITARKVATPTLIFDEVDVGISGPTAAVVGKMLRQLGQATQVFCEPIYRKLLAMAITICLSVNTATMAQPKPPCCPFQITSALMSWHVSLAATPLPTSPELTPKSS
ncbi:MAG: DNA repair protein RecN, partial [Ferrimonas sp.]